MDMSERMQHNFGCLCLTHMFTDTHGSALVSFLHSAVADNQMKDFFFENNKLSHHLSWLKLILRGVLRP